MILDAFSKLETLKKTFIPLPGNDGCACNECPHRRLNKRGKMVETLENMLTLS